MNEPQIIYKKGKTYIIDKGHANEGEVVLDKILNEAFGIVKEEDTDFSWEVRLKRLTEITKK